MNLVFSALSVQTLQAKFDNEIRQGLAAGNKSWAAFQT